MELPHVESRLHADLVETAAGERAVSAEAPHDRAHRALLARVASGDTDALGELFDAQAPAMLGVALRILGNRQDAEDLVHDVFIEVVHKAERYDPRRGRVRSWLLMRVRSRSIDRLRSLAVARKFGMAAGTPEELPETPDVAQAPNQENMADAIRARAALARLSGDQHAIVELAYFEGLSLREIAERKEIPLGTVKSRLAAALTTLRSHLIALEGAGK